MLEKFPDQIRDTAKRARHHQTVGESVRVCLWLVESSCKQQLLLALCVVVWHLFSPPPHARDTSLQRVRTHSRDTQTQSGSQHSLFSGGEDVKAPTHSNRQPATIDN